MRGWMWTFVIIEALLVVLNFAFFMTFLIAGNLMWIVSAIGVLFGLFFIRFMLSYR